MKTSPAVKEAAIQRLRALLKPGTKVWTILRHVSSSGMSRCIDLVTLVHDRRFKEIRPYYITNLVGDLLEHKQHDRGGLIVHGCGQDMGFMLVYDVGRALWPEGTKVKGRTPAAAERDGWYALNHGWL